MNELKIKKQYFQIPLMLILLVELLMDSITIMLEIKGLLTGYGMGYSLDRVEGSWIIHLVVLGGLAVVLLNEYLIGPTACILTAEGILIDGKMVQWNRIRRLEYNLGYPRRYGYSKEHVDVVMKNGDIRCVNNAPYRMVRKARKYSTYLESSCKGYGIPFAVFCTVAILIVAVISAVTL